MSHLGVMLFWSFVQITLVGTTALVACLLLKGCQARERIRVLQITFVLILGLSLLTFSPWPHWPSGRLAVRLSARAIETDVQTPANQVLTSATAISPGSREISPVSPSRNRLHTALTAPRTVSDSPVPEILTAAILVGSVIGACRCVVAVLAIRREVQAARPVTDAALLTLLGQLRADLGCRRLVAVVETDRLATAATVGWRKPVILLPVDWRCWSKDERRAVFAHELAHIVRQDFASLVIAQISAVLHFYHPLVHWLGARLQLEQELVADAMAAHAMGDRNVYLAVLATMALRKEARPMGWPARSFLPTRETILRRVEMLTESRHRTGKVRTSLAAASLAAIVVVGVLAAGLRSRDANAQLKPPPLSAKRPAESAEDLPTSRRNLQSLGLAMHGYYRDNGHFPPAVVDYPPKKSDDKFTGWYPDRLMALLGDGSARGFPIKLDKKVSTALIEMSDGATIDWSQIPNLTK